MEKYTAMAYVKLGHKRWGWHKVELEATDMLDARTKAEIAFRGYWLEGGIQCMKNS